MGCIARVGFTQAEIDGFKKGAKATLTIVPVAAPDQKVALDISLKGFTAGFDAVSKTRPPEPRPYDGSAPPVVPAAFVMARRGAARARR